MMRPSSCTETKAAFANSAVRVSCARVRVFAGMAAAPASLREGFYVPPLKSTEPTGISEAIDWQAGLLLVREALPAGGGQPSLADAHRAADALRAARGEAIRAHEANATSETIRGGVHGTVSYIELLARFERLGGGADLIRQAAASKLHFVWRNAWQFVERREHGGVLEFERLGLMFNLGVLLMGYAARGDVGLQPAALALQCAAGSFQAARAHAEGILESAASATPLHEDVLPPSLRALELLALGQGQCCFALHAEATTSAGVQGKLWGQAALDLREAQEMLPKCAAGAARTHVEALACTALAQAHFCAGAVRRSERKHGLAVSHLAFALEQLGKAEAATPRAASGLAEHLRARRKPIEVEYEVARRDNDNVYFEKEVPASELAHSIECKSMVSSIPPLANLSRFLGSTPHAAGEDALAGWEAAAEQRAAAGASPGAAGQSTGTSAPPAGAAAES